jgi:hypothetical protein
MKFAVSALMSFEPLTMTTPKTKPDKYDGLTNDRGNVGGEAPRTSKDRVPLLKDNTSHSE